MKSRKIDERAAALVDSISYWLGYQYKIGREKLIHEASLRYPIADTLSSKEIRINQIVLEKLHPIFKSKRIDLVVFNEDVSASDFENDDSRLNEVYEFKLVRAQTAEKEKEEHQRVFDDVVRLAYYNLWRKKDCYFLMCGKYDDFKVYFVGEKAKIDVESGRNIVSVKHPSSSESSTIPIVEAWQSSGIYKDWFSFDVNGEKRIVFDKKIEWGLKSFQNNYKIRENLQVQFNPEIEVKTTCLAITPNKLLNRTHAAGIWKIEGIK